MFQHRRHPNHGTNATRPMAEQDHISAVYRIRNTVNEKVYVGSAVNSRKRWLRHKYYLNKGTHYNRRLQAAWTKHGEPAFIFEIIEAVEREEDLDSREQVYLDAALASSLAYNICRTAGSMLGVTFTAATRAKMSARMLGNTRRRDYCAKVPVAERRPPPRSAETRARLSLALKGKPSAWKGRTASAESRAKMSAAKKGIPRSAETIAKMSAAMMGNTRRRDYLLALAAARNKL